MVLNDWQCLIINLFDLIQFISHWHMVLKWSDLCTWFVFSSSGGCIHIYGMFVLLWASINLETTCSHMRRERFCSGLFCQCQKNNYPFILSLLFFYFSLTGCLFDGGLCSSSQVCWDGECCHIFQFQFLTLVQCGLLLKKINLNDDNTCRIVPGTVV